MSSAFLKGRNRNCSLIEQQDLFNELLHEREDNLDEVDLEAVIKT